jgi:hypothetical protein
LLAKPCRLELRRRGLSVEGALSSKDQGFLADLDRLLLAHIIPEQPYNTPSVFRLVKEPLRTASLQQDDLNVFMVGTWP